MTIDKTILEAEREKLKTDFDNVTTSINSLEKNLITMRGNLNALNGAIQQVDKLLLMVETKTETNKDENI
jgi:hypothetical protein|tara:strand:- start:128 stop:337 length:210 start_codon:yes stop_codon:yes gene_type:complete